MRSSTEGGRSEKVDAYIASAPEFARPILSHIRESMHKASPEIGETIKWSRPFFVYRGVILGNMAAFTAHCSFGFWGAEMAAVLRADGIDGSEASGSFGRITTVEDLPPDKVLMGYLKQAIGLAAGAKGLPPAPKEKVRKRGAVAESGLAADLLAALGAKPGAKESFLKLSPSCRREYIQWIEEAKRPETRARRVATTVDQVGEGKALHWKYA